MNQLFKKNIPQNHTQLQLSGGFFTAPNFVYDLPVSSNAKSVLLNFCRRANGHGICYPSIKKICLDTGIKSQNTVRKAINELLYFELIKRLTPTRRGGPNRYVLSGLFLGFLNKRDKAAKGHKPYSTFEFPSSKIEQDPTQQLSTKEYTKKEYTHKERKCVLNQAQLDSLVKEWTRMFLSAFDRESPESSKQIRENLIKVAQRLSEKLPSAKPEELYKHSLGIIEWYIRAGEDTDPSRGNEWVYRGERRSSRLSKNFETVWADYWLMNKPVEEWKPDTEFLERREDVSDERLREAFNKLPWYRKSKNLSHSNGDTYG